MFDDGQNQEMGMDMKPQEPQMQVQEPQMQFDNSANVGTVSAETKGLSLGNDDFNAFLIPFQSIAYFFKGLYFVGFWENILLLPFVFVYMLICCTFYVGSALTGVGIWALVQAIQKTTEENGWETLVDLSLLDNPELFQQNPLAFFYIDKCLNWLLQSTGLFGVGISITLVSLVCIVAGALILGLLSIFFYFPAYIKICRTVELYESGKMQIRFCNFRCCWFPKGFFGHWFMIWLIWFITVLISTAYNSLAHIIEGIPAIGTIIYYILFFVVKFFNNSLFYASIIYVCRNQPFGGFKFVFKNFKDCMLFGLALYILGWIPVISYYSDCIAVVAGCFWVFHKSEDIDYKECDLEGSGNEMEMNEL